MFTLLKRRYRHTMSFDFTTTGDGGSMQVTMVILSSFIFSTTAWAQLLVPEGIESVSAEKIVCTQGGALGIRDASKKKILYSISNHQPIKITAAAPESMVVNGQTMNYVQVQLSKKETGWVLQNYVKSPAECVAAGLAAPADTTVRFNSEDMKNPSDWKRQYFDLVVAVNKNPGVQTLDAYYKGQWVKHVGVSTAIEETVSGTNLDGTPNVMFATTPVGYHTVTRGALRIDHHSNAFSGSYMPFAVFFDQEGGYATHEAPPGTEYLLGRKASHGCVRMPREEAMDIFFTVAMTGGPFNPSAFQGECLDGYSYDASCVSTANTNTRNDQALASLALVLAEGKGMTPASSTPMIPKVTIYGQPILNPATGNLDTEPGYRTLYVVYDAPLAPGAVKIPANSPKGTILGIPADSDTCVTIASKSKDTWGRPQQLLNEKCLWEPTSLPMSSSQNSWGSQNNWGRGNSSSGGNGGRGLFDWFH